MDSVQRGPVIAVLGEAGLLAAVFVTVGLTAAAWAVGMACGVAAALLLQRALARRGQAGLAPADWVTLTRMVLVAAVAALATVDAPASLTAIVWLAAVALVLDGVDGQVARRTGTASELGARFDMEVDAFLILVLSLVAAREFGWWVLAIGAARYVFVVASRPLPWMRGRLPYRYWRKVVAAFQGVALLVAVSGRVPSGVATALLVLALVLLLESFGRDVLWLWRRRDTPVQATDALTDEIVSPSAIRRAA